MNCEQVFKQFCQRWKGESCFSRFGIHLNFQTNVSKKIMLLLIRSIDGLSLFLGDLLKIEPK